MVLGLVFRYVIEMECCVGFIFLEKFYVIGKLLGWWDFLFGFV